MYEMLFLIAFLFCFVLLYKLLQPAVKSFSINQTYQNGYIIDTFVDTVIEKAVIYAFISANSSEKTIVLKEKKFNDTVYGIISDVLLGHNISPKNYNLQALVLITQFKLGLNKFIETPK